MMATGQVTVSINGVDYPMACAPGEEDKVIALGKRIDEVARQISSASGAIGEARILVMAALILTDKMTELESKLSEAGGNAAEDHFVSESQIDADKMAEVINSLTTRLEKLASR